MWLHLTLFLDPFVRSATATTQHKADEDSSFFLRVGMWVYTNSSRITELALKILSTLVEHHPPPLLI